MPVLLALVPHPDDEAYAFGGAIAAAAAAGWECQVACASSGELGKRHDGGSTAPAAVAAAREAELAASCAILGAKPPGFWRLPDGGLRESPPSRSVVSEAIAAAAPDLLVALGADGAYGHPDHLAVHDAVLGAWRGLPAAARPPLLFAAFPKGLFLPQYRKCIGMLGYPPSPPASAIGAAPAHYALDVRAFAPAKLAAVAAHRSQLPGGDPHALFPPGILAALLETEWYSDATGASRVSTRALLASLAPLTGC